MMNVDEGFDMFVFVLDIFLWSAPVFYLEFPTC